MCRRWRILPYYAGSIIACAATLGHLLPGRLNLCSWSDSPRLERDNHKVVVSIEDMYLLLECDGVPACSAQCHGVEIIPVAWRVMACVGE